jgi:16S rRNA (uracil1498-N3)-methyltransferase
MSRRRFFVDEVRNGQASIAGEEAKHLTRVLRVEKGEQYEISDNRSVYLAEVSLAHKGEVVFDVLEPVALKPVTVEITLYAALFKFDHFEWMLEKATELGVSRIVPVIATRSERGLDIAAQKRIERWRRIVLEASQQSRRDRLPEVELPVRLPTAVNASGEFRVFLDENPGAPALLRVLDGKMGNAVALALGPEGGWTEEERKKFVEEGGWTAASLGPQILRAETAAIAGLAVVQAAAGVAG